MPVLQRPDAEIHYQETGSGFPILLFAPGGLRSRMEMWHSPPGTTPKSWNDWTEALADKYRVVAMDQRNAGASRGAIRHNHGWHTYAGDHIALMDHLGHKRFHVLGGCIGASYCLSLAELAPERLGAAVLQNPIGVDPESPDYFPKSHAEWSAEQMEARPDLDPEALASFGRNMWGLGFAFSVSREFCRTCPVPTMLLPGSDTPHPKATSDELAALLPGVDILQDWKGPAHLDVQLQRVRAFLAKHTPT